MSRLSLISLWKIEAKRYSCPINPCILKAEELEIYLMGKKEAKRLRQGENHSYRELCENLFHMKLEYAEFIQKPLTQDDIDWLPQMIRLANESKIQEVGLNPNIDPKFRLQAEQNKTLEAIMDEGLYYCAIEGSVPTGLFEAS